MSKGISEDAQIHISIAFLIKAMIAVAVVVGSWYQAQMQFAEHTRRIQDLEDKITILNASVEGADITTAEPAISLSILSVFGITSSLQKLFIYFTSFS